MIANPFTTIAQKAIIVVLGLLVAVLGTAAGMLWWEGRGLRGDLAVCAAKRGELSASLALQNQAVVGFQNAASAAQATTQKALEAVRAGNKATAPELKRLADLMAAGKATDCGSAMLEIREGLR